MSACDLTFTPVESFVGGALIGLSAAATLLGYGRVLGFSGILLQGTAGPLFKGGLPHLWRVLVLIGLVLGGLVASSVAPFPSPTLEYPLFAYAAAGLVAGFGTACGSGCTSGHGICGLGRLSPRSFVAVCTFCAAAAATSTTTIAVIDGGCTADTPWLAPLALPTDTRTLLIGAGTPVAVLGTFYYLTFAWLRPATHPLIKPLGIDHYSPSFAPVLATLHAAVALSTGVTAGVGLVLAGMLNQNKVRERARAAAPPALATTVCVCVPASLCLHACNVRWQPATVCRCEAS